MTEETQTQETLAENQTTPPQTQADEQASTEKKGPTKFERAERIFQKNFGKVPRKDIIKQFIEEVELTPNGASTYYQKLKKAAES